MAEYSESELQAIIDAAKAELEQEKAAILANRDDILAEKKAKDAKHSETLSATVEQLEAAQKELSERREAEAQAAERALEDKALNEGEWKALLESKTKGFAESLEEIKSNSDEQIKALAEANSLALEANVAMREKLNKAEVDRNVSAAVAAIGVKKELTDIASNYIRTQTKVEVSDDGVVTVFVEKDGKKVPVTDFAQEWAKTEAGKALVSAPAHKGNDNPGTPSGSTGSVDTTIKNPYLPGGQLQDRIELSKSNPELAKQFKKAAGFQPERYAKT